MNLKRLVVKVGTSLVTRDGGHLHRPRLARLARELATIQKSGVQVVLVTSGAIAAGVSELGWRKRPSELEKKQAAAAVGQPRLMETYRQSFRRWGVRVAQVLLTSEDFEHGARKQNMKATLSTLLSEGAVPIINENDSVGVQEIRFGDNDTLAALVAVSLKADLLVLLTDVDGLMTSHPRSGRGDIIREIKHISSSIDAMAQGAGSDHGTGGMITKVRAARHATAHGVTLVIANGAKSGILPQIIRGVPVGTRFLPR